MRERINTPFTAEHFVAYCLKMVGHPYWYGTCGYKATSGLLSRKARQYSSHYTSSRTSRYKQDIANKEVVCDCIGGAKGYAWTGGGQAILDAIGTDKSIPSTYGSHGCPDKGANSMFRYAKSKGCAWGTISTLPEVPGLALTKNGHVGYYIGNGWAVEWEGFTYGCVKTQVCKRSWTHWYALPFIDYGDAIKTAPVRIPDTAATEYTLGSRSLANGSKGTDVKTLQELLLQLGFSLPKYSADGSFGSETATAVKAFQSKNGIKADGIYGSETHAALMAAVADQDEAQSPSEPVKPDDTVQTPETPDVPLTAPKKVSIVCNSGTVNIRAGNDTKYSRITATKNGASFEWVATAKNGWHAVVVNRQVGWVSGEFSSISR